MNGLDPDEVSLDGENPLAPDSDSLRQARADRMRMETESSTLAGFSQMHVRTVTRMSVAHEAQVAGINARWQQREAALLAEMAQLRESLNQGSTVTYQSFVEYPGRPHTLSIRLSAEEKADLGHTQALLAKFWQRDKIERADVIRAALAMLQAELEVTGKKGRV